MKSWKTTLLGVAGFVVVGLQAAIALFDADDVTNPNWNLVGTAFLTMIGLFFARDNNITSEKAGAK